MTAIVEIPIGHFSGQRGITNPPGGSDVRTLEDLIRELQDASNVGFRTLTTDLQLVAATAETIAFIAPAAGEITYAAAAAGVTAASGESETVDVEINGTTALAAAITLDNAAGITVVEGTLAAAVAIAAGDLITVNRVYTAGGGPTPMSAIACTIGIRFSR